MITDPKDRRTVAQNRKARHLYTVLDELEAGMVLQGTEVKSLREGQCSLQEAWVRIKDGELWLVGCHIPEYAHGNRMNHEPTRERKLLAHRREIEKWSKQVREKGTTVVPLEVYFAGQRAKLLVGLVRGKKLHDKRQGQRERDDRREMEREARRRR
jgi:SsrA-binding protein